MARPIFLWQSVRSTPVSRRNGRRKLEGEFELSLRIREGTCRHICRVNARNEIEAGTAVPYDPPHEDDD